MYEGFGIDHDTKPFEQFDCLLVLLPRVDQSSSRSFATEKQICRNRERRHESKFLIDGRDTSSPRCERRSESDFTSKQNDFAGISPMHTHQYFD